MIFKKALVALALAQTSVAQAAPAKCMQPAEAEALIITLMPDTLLAVARRCESTLPQSALLRTGSAALAAQWRVQGAGKQADAAAAMTIFMDDALKGGDTTAMLSLVRTSLVNEIVGRLKTSSCSTIERGITLAAPLPLPNIAGLFVMLAVASGTNKAESLPICKVAKP